MDLRSGSPRAEAVDRHAATAEPLAQEDLVVESLTHDNVVHMPRSRKPGAGVGEAGGIGIPRTGTGWRRQRIPACPGGQRSGRRRRYRRRRSTTLRGEDEVLNSLAHLARVAAFSAEAAEAKQRIAEEQERIAEAMRGP